MVAIAISYGHLLEKPALPDFLTLLMQFLNFSWHFTLIMPITDEGKHGSDTSAEHLVDSVKGVIDDYNTPNNGFLQTTIPTLGFSIVPLQ
jgi:hypothetical protein